MMAGERQTGMSTNGVNVPGDTGRAPHGAPAGSLVGGRWSLRPGRLLGFGLAVVAVVMLVSIIGIFVVLERELTRQSNENIRNTPWAVYQMFAEALRTTDAISDVLARPAQPTDVDLERIRNRFDVFYSRIAIYRDSPNAKALREAWRLDALIGPASVEAEELAKLLDGVPDAASARPLLMDLHDRLSKKIPAFAILLSQVQQMDTLQRLEAREEVKRLYRMLATAIGGLALSMLGLLVVLVRQMRASARTQARVEAIERENLAKSLAILQRDEQAALLRREAALAETVNVFNAKLNTSVTRLASKIEDIAARCTAMTQVVEQAREGSENASESSARVADRVSSVARTADAMSHAARDMATKTVETNLTANDARSEAERTGQAIQQLASAASHISSITKLIASIAGRTNLLALNATIEAARAGEAGRGFAVVAAEVKSLAQQTSDAISGIARQIQAIQTASASCIDAMGGIHDRIGSLGDIGAQIGAIVESQSRSVEHMATMIRDATHETSAASSTARSVSLAAVDANAAAEAVLSLVVEVNEEGRRIRRDIERFQDTINASADAGGRDRVAAA
jgi:methyl-accepting chemotaxis protein